MGSGVPHAPAVVEWRRLSTLALTRCADKETGCRSAGVDGPEVLAVLFAAAL